MFPRLGQHDYRWQRSLNDSVSFGAERTIKVAVATRYGVNRARSGKIRSHGAGTWCDLNGAVTDKVGNARYDLVSYDTVTVASVIQLLCLGRRAVNRRYCHCFIRPRTVFTFSTQLTTSVSYHDNAQGMAVITVDTIPADTITLWCRRVDL